VSSERPAKFFVNAGLVSNPADIYHLLRPLHRQTVAYKYMRGDRVVAHGTGWVERIVADRPDVSSFFTPLSICLSVASWEHLEFETRPDQLISYVLVQGDERVILQFVPPEGAPSDGTVQEELRFAPDYVQMDLGVLGGSEPGESASREAGERATEEAPPRDESTGRDTGG
jgi:hypothetical protein